jgi:hypothetical protein
VRYYDFQEENMKRISFFIAVICLLAGFIGCSSAPKYAKNSDIPWEVFYPVTEPGRSLLPETFFIEVFIIDPLGNNLNMLVANQVQGGETREIKNPLPSDRTILQKFRQRIEDGKKYRLHIEKGDYRWNLIGINGVPINNIFAELQEEVRVERAAEEARLAEERRQREEERQQPRFSPEGQEYIKRTLIQAVGESRNQANRGKTVFFESTGVRLRNTGIAGQYLVDDIRTDSVLMEFYGTIPMNLADALAKALLGGYGDTILYRVEINQLGIARFVIDSFRQ